jgi:type II secretory pathway pseudopilin PulG
MLEKMKKLRGQTLIEALTALGLIAIVITAIGVAVTAALSNAKYNQNETLATKYAQQGSEIVNQIRDDNYNNFKTYAGTYCLASGDSALGVSQPSGCTTPNIDNTYIRSVDIVQGGCAANVAHVTVTVSFRDGKCEAGAYCHKVIDDSCFSTVNPIQAP